MAALIAIDSPLRALPHGLSTKQIVFFDALRISAEIAGQAYDDLLGELRVMQAERDPDRPKNAVAAVRHAWTFVDAVHRFRAVLQQAPGIKHNYVWKLFMQRTESVKDMRDTAQHLNNELEGIAKMREGAYGTLTWVLGSGQDHLPKQKMLNVGAAYGVVRGPMIDFEERLPAGEIHRPQLALGDKALILSDTLEHVASMVRSLEGAMAEFAEDKPKYGSDQFVSFDLIPLDEHDDSSVDGGAPTGEL